MIVPLRIGSLHNPNSAPSLAGLFVCGVGWTPSNNSRRFPRYGLSSRYLAAIWRLLTLAVGELDARSPTGILPTHLRGWPKPNKNLAAQPFQARRPDDLARLRGAGGISASPRG